MDKYEYRKKTEQMLAHIEQKNYVSAMEIADSIDWRRVKNTVMLCATSEVYEQNNQLNKSRDILFIAYDRAPDNKKIIYRLGILALKQGDLSEAMDCYEEFVNIAPKDPNQYILRYKILRLQGSSILLQIEALKAFRVVEYIERWAFELVKLYDEAGMTVECLTECDDMIMWFGQGKYLKDILDMKLKYDALSDQQVELYEQFMPQQVIAPVPVVEPKAAFIAPPVVPAPSVNFVPHIAQSEVDTAQFIHEQGMDVPVQEAENIAQNEYEAINSMDTKIINQEELDQINAATNPALMATQQIDIKAVRAAQTPPPIVVRGVQAAVPIAGVASTVASVVDQVPTKIRESAIMPETTGQLRIDEILTGWEEKQREVEEAIAVEKVKGEEKFAIESKIREEERIKRELEKVENEEPVLPDDIRKMIEDIEGGVDLSEVEPPLVQEIEPIETPQEAEVENKGEVLQNELYIEEEFHDNVFEAEEEYSELTADLDQEETPRLEDLVPQEMIEVEEKAQETERNFEENQSLEIETEVPKTEAPKTEASQTEVPQTEAPQTEVPQTEVSIEPEIEQYVPNMDEIEAILTQGDLLASVNQEYTEEEYDGFIGEEKAPLSRIEMAKAVATGRTSKIPADDVRRATVGVSQDTGYIVQAKYDLDAQSQIGLKAGLSEEQKQMFSYFVPVRGMSEQLVDVLDRDKVCVGREGSSNTGNLLIVGRKGSGKTVLAVDVVKAIQKNRGIQNGKVAIVTGDALNKKKISDIVSKLYGGALIIEKASKMNDKTITRLNKAMERDTGEMLIVLEDERKPLDSVLATNFEFRRRFTSRLEVPVFINDELVTFAQTYAKENAYKIDEMGILALYSRIDSEQREDYNVSVSDVKDIMDAAIADSQKGGVKKLAKKLFNKPDEIDSYVLLTEKNFN